LTTLVVIQLSINLGLGDKEMNNDKNQPKLMSRGALIFFIAAPILLSILMLFGLVLLWPSPDNNSIVPIESPEVQMFLVVAIAGGIGSTVRLMRVIPQDYRRYYDKEQGSNQQDVPEGSFERGIPFYILRPFLGPPVAVIVYFALRGGLLSTDTTLAQINIFFMVAVGGLAGLFSDSAVDKLKQVFDVFLGVQPEKREGIEVMEKDETQQEKKEAVEPEMMEGMVTEG
jgi:hypothetical protein